MNGPQDWITTSGLIAASAAGLVGCAASVGRVTGVGRWGPLAERVAAAALTALCAAVFIYRAVAVHETWAPLTSHVDGLALLAALLGVVLVWEQWTRRLPGVAMFMLGVLTVLALWGVCASWWTLRRYQVQGVWHIVHLLSVYLGTLGVAAAAAAGALWLYVDRQLRRRDHAAQRLRVLGRLADLESVEGAIRVSATAGFVLLSIALATGLVIALDRPDPGAPGLGAEWWRSPKVVLAAAVWAIFALVMHVRYVPNFRGRRAAVLSIVGFVLLIAVMGIAQALGEGKNEPPAGSRKSEARGQRSESGQPGLHAPAPDLRPLNSEAGGGG